MRIYADFVNNWDSMVLWDVMSFLTKLARRAKGEKGKRARGQKGRRGKGEKGKRGGGQKGKGRVRV
jgi:hypothetical protein